MSKSISAQLWQEAYDAIKADPDELEIYEKFTKAITGGQGQGSAPDLGNEKGREKLTKTIERLTVNMESSSSQKTKVALEKLQKLRNLIATGAAANPCATVAVAGLFIAFDLILLHQAEEAYIAEIVTQVADIACLNELRYRAIIVQPNEHPKLSEMVSEQREELKAAFVQLNRISLLLTMKIVYRLNSWQKYFLATGSWGSKLKTLQDADTRAKEYFDIIERQIRNPPEFSSNWICEKIPKLHRLVRDGRHDDVYTLIETGHCPPSVLNEKTQCGWTALMFAVRDGQWKIMTYLLRVNKILVNAKNNDGNTALIIAAQNNRSGHIKKLIEAGAKLDKRNKYKRTAWQEAAMRGKLNAMKMLLEKGDDIDQVTGKNGYSALHTAVDKDNVRLLKWLLEKGANTDIKIKAGVNIGSTPRGLAEKRKNEKLLKILPQNHTSYLE